MRHLDEGTIHAWLDEALSADERDQVARHAAECADCAAAIAEARGLVAGASRIVGSLDVVRGNVLPAGSAVTPAKAETKPKQTLWSTLRLTPARAAIAATLLVAAGSMLTLRHQPTASAPVVPKELPEPVASAPSVTLPAKHDSVAPSTKRRLPPKEEIAVAPPSAAPPAAAAAAAAAPPQAAAEMAPMMAQKATLRAESSVGARDLRRTGVSLMEVTTTGVAAAAPRALGLRSSAASSDACYRLSADTANWLANLPRLFALTHDSTGANVVRPVSVDGKIESSLIDGRWDSAGPVVKVFVGQGDAEVTLNFVNAARVQASAGSRSASVQLQPVPCHR